jgi:hypothetical protein
MNGQKNPAIFDEAFVSFGFVLRDSHADQSARKPPYRSTDSSASKGRHNRPGAMNGPSPGIARAPIPSNHLNPPPSSAPVPAPVVAPKGAIMCLNVEQAEVSHGFASRAQSFNENRPPNVD